MRLPPERERKDYVDRIYTRSSSVSNPLQVVVVSNLNLQIGNMSLGLHVDLW